MNTKPSKADAYTGNDSPDSLKAVRADFLEAPSRHCDEFVRAFHEAEYQEAVRLTDDIADYRGEHVNLLPSEVEIQKHRIEEAEARLGTIISELKSNAAGAEREARGREQRGAGKEPNKEDAKDKSDLEAHIRILREMIDEIMVRWEKARSPASLRTKAPSPSTDLPPKDSARCVSKTERRDLLTPVIEGARRECADPLDPPAVWAVLVRMAESRKAPLLGVSDEGIKWQDSNDEPKFLTLKNLRDRLRRIGKKAR